ncbi:MAG: ribonuclease J, partial [Clostridia bacterium]|nr:ribonuclease J [Clostridia bacterium]
THGHEDHIGAIQYYPDIDCPIYGTALTLSILNRKIEDRDRVVNLKRVNEGDTINLGCFSVEFIKVAHSMAGACALSITTPVGVIFFTGDFKMDKSPIDNKPTNIKRIKEIGDNGVALMLGESTNIERHGHSTSEKIVGKGLEKIFKENPDKRIVIACFASSNYRVQQILWLAQKFDRKVVLAGRSMRSIVDVAAAADELKIPKNIIISSANAAPPEKTVVIATGSQGEPDSALFKLSRDDFGKGLSIGEDDVVVLSSTPIPGNEKSVYNVINDLFRQGANVIYDSMNDVHVSGHAYEDELKEMLELVRPKYFMPVHGEYRHQFKHAELAKQVCVQERNVIIPNIGEVWGLSRGSLKQYSNIPAGNIYVDGEVMEDGNSIVRDRKNLAEFGILIVLASVDANKGKINEDIDVIPRGIYISDEKRADIITVVTQVGGDPRFDEEHLYELTAAVKKAVRKLFYRDRQFPVVIPVIIQD